MLIALTGATGFIGPHVVARLQREGYTVRALGRRDPGIDGVAFAPWDSTREPSPETLRDVGAVVHLAGEPVAQRWSSEVKRRIRDSRVLGTRNLVNAIARMPTKPTALIGASAIGYYGDRGEEVLTEASEPGKDFLAQTCVEWERESRRAGEFDIRVALLRIGIVLGREGGALKQMVGPFKAGIGGPVGSGKQWVSWIHVEDIVGLIEFTLRYDRVYGTINATSPQPVRNVDFAKELGTVLGRPSLVPVPAFGLKLMYGEMANVVLASQRVIPEAASRAGYPFRYPELRDSLRQILT